MSANDQFTDNPIDTGITAAVTTTLTQEAVQAAKLLVGLPDDLTPVMLAQLAREIAQDLGNFHNLISKYNLTQAQYDFLFTYNDFFKHTLQDQIKTWQGVERTEDRLRLQALAALEEQMPAIASRMGKQSEKLEAVVEAAKFFANLGRVDTQAGRPLATGERFTINIDLGADARLTIGAAGSQEARAHASGTGEIRGNTEGAHDLRTLPLLKQGP
ncbi:MAG: hypothetical protein KGL39_55675 [Patescibacteria group bacterium]|nr:hypothetical protein [Patescibacteria group bacterium]